MAFADFFQRLTCFWPYPWQQRFAEWEGRNIAAVTVPTGAGKEFGVVLPWLYAHAWERAVPSRLIYCLPTRSLVDQVYRNIKKMVRQSGLRMPVYCLKGGQIESGYEDRLVERAILVGTQDQLLSRALNRGYATAWSQRPKHAAALNNDCRWVLDETQLMGVGYTSAVQLHQQRQELGAFGRAELVLMSATLDLRPIEKYPHTRYELNAEDWAHPFLKQKLEKLKPLMRVAVSSTAEIAAIAQQAHQPGQLTLVVLNQVKRVREVSQLLQARGLPVLAMHSRFLGFHRRCLQRQLYRFRGIVVATQVVEAGVDLDASVLITETCPWSSFVQRVGRCGRTNMEQSSQVYWLDWQTDWSPKPYTLEECRQTQVQLESMEDAGLVTLAKVSMPSPNPLQCPLDRKKLQQFFNTHSKPGSPLESATAYVRDAVSFSVRVFWAEALLQGIPHFRIQGSSQPVPLTRIPRQRCLCPVPKHELVAFIAERDLTYSVWREDKWHSGQTIELGDVVCLACADGGYHLQQGWTGNPDDRPLPYSLRTPSPYDDDPPFHHWLSLQAHSGDAADFMAQDRAALQRAGLSEATISVLIQCARWHDWGKAHALWQRYARATGKSAPMAKSVGYGHPRELQGFRHELASAIAAAQQGASFLAQYLIATHHGKVRESLQSPDGTFDPHCPRGVKLGTTLPAVDLGREHFDALTLVYPNVKTWKKEVYQLLKQYGPFRLWYLETLVRNADVQASRYREEKAKHGCK